MYHSTNPNASINKSVSVSSNLFYETDTCFSLKQEDLSILPGNVSVRNSVCNTDKHIVKCVRKCIFKSVSTSSLLPGKHISDCNVSSNKLLSASSVRPSKLNRGSNVH